MLIYNSGFIRPYFLDFKLSLWYDCALNQYSQSFQYIIIMSFLHFFCFFFIEKYL